MQGVMRRQSIGMTVAPLEGRCLVTTPGRCDVTLLPAGDNVAFGEQVEVVNSLWREGMA